MPCRFLLPCGLFLAALFPWLHNVNPAAAQAPDAKGKDVRDVENSLTFRTYDDVTLQGYLHRSTKAGTPAGRSPVVMLLHGYGDDPRAGDFHGLARDLSGRGFNVLQFDFRGHGQSTLIASKFWDDPINKAFMPSLAKMRPPKDKIKLDDFRSARRGGYFPRLADDIMAARVALDQLNDSGEVNTSSVYLIGAKDAVTVGMLYLAAEWSRPQKLPPIIGQFPALMPRNQQGLLGPGDACAGWDVAGAVWLSATRHPSVSLPTMQSWVLSAPDMRERTPMLFLYGDEDGRAKSEAKSLVNEVLAAQVRGSAAPKLPLTRAIGIEKTKLNGVNLLGKQLETEKIIVEYLESLEKERKNMIRVPNRGFASPPPGIVFPAFGVCKI